jgi:hypothetical protein
MRADVDALFAREAAREQRLNEGSLTEGTRAGS